MMAFILLKSYQRGLKIMKKQLIILAALTTIGSPWALAQSSDITVTPLPPAATSTVEFNLYPESSTDTSSVNAAVEAALAEATSVIRVYQHIQHVDLRDVIKYDNEIAKKLKKINGITDDAENSKHRLPGTSRKILAAVAADTERFIGLRGIRYFENGAKGPSGEKKLVPHKETERNEFIISRRYPETYTNTLYSVDYTSAKEIAPAVIEAELLLFAHSSSKGPFFKKITVVVDWSKKNQGLENFVAITKSEDDILLKDTDFNLKGSISDQKIILEDSNFGLTKVFPVTVGAIDARDNIIESMNFHVPLGNRRRARKACEAEYLKNSPGSSKNAAQTSCAEHPLVANEFQDFSNAALIKRSKWDTGSSWANTSERTYPHDYRGRPFMALIDMNYVNYTGNGTDYADGYREVGVHYQITSAKLERGFRSHGCVRVRDKDLYQVDAIVNQGPKDLIKSIFKNELPQHESITHPHTFNNNVAMVKYTDRHSLDYQNGSQKENILCKINPDKSRSVRWNNAASKDYHTVIGNDCLTSTSKETGVTSADVKAYWNGTGGRIRPHIVNQEHGPIAKATEILLRYGYSSFAIAEMEQRDRLETAEGLEKGAFSPIQKTIQNILAAAAEEAATNPPPTVVSIWPSYEINSFNLIGENDYNRIDRNLRSNYNGVSRKDKIRYYKRTYFYNCMAASRGESHPNCRDFEAWAKLSR